MIKRKEKSLILKKNNIHFRLIILILISIALFFVSVESINADYLFLIDSGSLHRINDPYDYGSPKKIDSWCALEGNIECNSMHSAVICKTKKVGDETYPAWNQIPCTGICIESSGIDDGCYPYNQFVYYPSASLSICPNGAQKSETPYSGNKIYKMCGSSGASTQKPEDSKPEDSKPEDPIQTIQKSGTKKIGETCIKLEDCESLVCDNLKCVKCVSTPAPITSNCPKGWECKDPNAGLCTKISSPSTGGTGGNAGGTDTKNVEPGKVVPTSTTLSGRCGENSISSGRSCQVPDATKNQDCWGYQKYTSDPKEGCPSGPPNTLCCTPLTLKSGVKCDPTKDTDKCHDGYNLGKCIGDKWTLTQCPSGQICVTQENKCVDIKATPPAQTGGNTQAPVCDPTAIVPFISSSPCTCQGKVLEKDSFCCFNEKQTQKEDDCRSTCGFRVKIEKECMCGPSQVVSKGKVCCSEGVVKDNVEDCPPLPCDKRCDRTNTFTNEKPKCDCPDYCSNKGVISKDSTDKTCGRFDIGNMCSTSKGECVTETECTEGSKTPEGADPKIFKPKYLTYSKNEGLDASCSVENPGSGKLVCCTLNDAMYDEPAILYNCIDTCRNPKGCQCPNECLPLKGQNYSKESTEGVTGFNVIRMGFTCKGEYHLVPGARSPDCKMKVKDGFCPSGCFWFTDKDCGKDANIGNVIWDFLPMKKFKKDYEEGWAQKMRDLGARFDLNFWTQSVCNPTSKEYSSKGKETDVLVGTTEMVGWIGGKKDRYGEGNYSYAITWYIGGLYENNTYTVSLKNQNTELFLWNKKEMNISIGEIHQGNKTQATVIGKVSYDKVCINFNNSIRPTGKDSLNKDGNAIKTICRSF